MPPSAAVVVEHAGEVTVWTGPPTGGIEGRTGESQGPGIAAIGGSVEFVGAGGETAALLIHAGDIDRAVPRVPYDLDIADEWGGRGQRALVGPSQSIVGRVADPEAASI